MTRKIVTVDWDDLISPFFFHFLPWSAENKGTALTYEEMTEYDCAKLMRRDPDDVRTWINHYASHHQHECEPNSNDIEGLRQLHTQHDLHILTSRPEFQRSVIEDHARRHGIFDLFDGATFTNSFGNDPNAPRTDKPTVCRRLCAVAHLDDAPSHAIDVGKIGIPVYVPPRPWNKGKLPSTAIHVRDIAHAAEIHLGT